MAKPKCQYCGATIDDKDFAYCVQAKSRNQYYCTHAEYIQYTAEKKKQEQVKQDIFKIVKRIVSVYEFDKRLNILVNGYIKTHGAEKILALLTEYEDNFASSIYKKGIDSSDKRISYFDACVKRTINDFYYVESVNFESVETDFEYYGKQKYKGKERKSINKWVNEYE